MSFKIKALLPSEFHKINTGTLSHKIRNIIPLSIRTLAKDSIFEERYHISTVGDKNISDADILKTPNHSQLSTLDVLDERPPSLKVNGIS